MIIPNSVTSIGRSAFEGCVGLTSVNIPNAVTSIGDKAFYGCPLDSVTIPNGVTIGNGAFVGCQKAIIHCNSVDNDWFHDSYVFDDRIYDEHGETIDGSYRFEVYLNHSLKELEIGKEVTSVNYKVFAGCDALEKVVFHCKEIGSNWFGSWSDNYYERNYNIYDGFYQYYFKPKSNMSLKEIVIGEEVTTIGMYAFNCCVGLTSVTIPNNVTNVGRGAFPYCSKAIFHCKKIGSRWFDGIDLEINFNTDNGYDYDWGDWVPNTSLNEVVIGDEVTTVGENAFAACHNLTSVTIGDNVTSIRENAFAACYNLTSVTIGDNVTSIGNMAFSNCPLDSVTIPKNVTSVGRGAFSNCTKAIFHCKEIGSSWFDDFIGDDYDWALYDDFIHLGHWESNTNLNEIVVGDEVTTIGENAFSDCQGLASVTIGDNVTSIGEKAFNGCPFPSITIPNSVTNIGKGAFEECNNLATVTINSNYLVSQDYSKDSSYPFLSMFGKQVKKYIIGNDVKNIGQKAFYNCSELTSLTIGDNVTGIGESAFSDCNSLPSVVIPNSVIIIGDSAFNQCNGLTSLILGENVTSIGESAFYGCSGIPSLTIPNSVTNIGRGAFEECNNLATVTINSNYLVSQDYSKDSSYPFLSMFGKQVKKYIIGNDVKNIGQKAFYNCSELTSLTIGDNVTGIGESAFSDCNSLPSVVIPNSVIIIGDSAFNQCNGLTSLILGENVTSIGESAFYGCSGIPSLTIPNSVASIGSSAFSGCSGFTSLTIPNSVISIGESAFSGCNGLTSMMIGDHLTSIGANAFAGCSGLKAVKSEGMTPASISDNSAFPNRADIVLCVPKGSKPMYGSAYCWKDFKAIKEITDGDVNVDYETDVIDVVDIARFVVGTPSERFVEFLADINYDDKVNIGDAVALVNEIAGDQHFVKSSTVNPLPEIHEMLTLTEKADGNLALNLVNQRGYTAFQFDVMLPEGVDIMQMALSSSRKQKHQLLYSKVEDGHYRVVALSTSNHTFSGNQGELLEFFIDSSVHDGILIDDIHFFTPNGQDYLFDAVSLSGTTGIETVAEDKELQDGGHPALYDMQGRKILSPAGRKGIYIVNGKKVVIK